MKTNQRLSIAILVVMFLLSGMAALSAAKGQTLMAVSQQSAEPKILVEMVKQLIEAHTDLKVEHKQHFQGVSIVHAAFMSRDVDFYVSHTGSQFTGVLHMEVTDAWRNREKVLDYVQAEFQNQFNATWFEPFGFNNTYALVMRKDAIEALGIETMEDLAEHAPDLVVGMDQVFMGRIGDGYYDMADYYDLKFKQTVSMDYDLMYRAVDAGDVDVAVAYSTDGRIASLDLGILQDNKQFFPPYDGSLIVHNDVLKEFPVIRDVVEPLLGRIDEAEMAALNSKVDVEHLEPEDVAREYLEKEGLL
ncbi:MAG: osmoprotectant ABC transporter substrate-binding protein [Firmicutes bacterium]|nr:osmoprotectant ABC transporter substrate-binding protein [Bacillota bacterium]